MPNDLQLLEDMQASNENTKCDLQNAMLKDPTGKDFLAKLEKHLQGGTDPDALNIIFGDMNFNADMVNDGIYDYKFAVSILKEYNDEQRKKLYDLAKQNIFKNNELDDTFVFEKEHNAFQAMHNTEKNVKDIFEFKIGKMAESNFNYNSPRVGNFFGQNLIIGLEFDDKYNIRLQRWSSTLSGIGFYFYVGDEKKIEQKFFVDCFYSDNKFKMTKLTLQMFVGAFGIGNYVSSTSEEIAPDFTIENIKDKYPGKIIYIDADPFSDINMLVQENTIDITKGTIKKLELKSQSETKTGSESGTKNETKTGSESGTKNENQSEQRGGGKSKTKKRKGTKKSGKTRRKTRRKTSRKSRRKTSRKPRRKTSRKPRRKKTRL
jgi:hypothetical protein